MKNFLPTIFFIIGDYFAIVAAESTAFFIRNEMDFWNNSYYSYSGSAFWFFVPAIFLIFLLHSHAYRRMRPIIETIRAIFMAVFYAWVAAIIVIYFLKAGEQISRLYILLLLPEVLFYVAIIRYAILKFFKLRNIFTEDVVVVGAGKTAELILKFWEQDLGYRYNILGFVDDSPVSTEIPKKFPIIGSFKNLKKILINYKSPHVIIAAPGADKETLNRLIQDTQLIAYNVSFVPDLFGTPFSAAQTEILFSQKILLLNLKNNLANYSNRILKRIFDLTLTITGGLCILPFMIIIAVAVAIDQRGSILFKHRRIGRHGKFFNCLKFQTMNPKFNMQNFLKDNPQAQEEWNKTFKLENDPRVSKFGKFLRKYSIDELPQIFNVLKGEMSLVGPRPITEQELKLYGENSREYLMIRPGITGFWQVSGRSDTTYAERVEMDSWYVKNWSVWIDIWILFKTIKAVVNPSGAY